jgi:hypothetical protein
MMPAFPPKGAVLYTITPAATTGAVALRPVAPPAAAPTAMEEDADSDSSSDSGRSADMQGVVVMRGFVTLFR